jgi:hypothetical protein
MRDHRASEGRPHRAGVVSIEVIPRALVGRDLEIVLARRAHLRWDLEMIERALAAGVPFRWVAAARPQSRA